MIDPNGSFELAIYTLFVHVKQVAGIAVAANRAVLHGPGFGVFIGFPSIERSSVENGFPFVGLVTIGKRHLMSAIEGYGAIGDQCGKKQQLTHSTEV